MTTEGSRNESSKRRGEQGEDRTHTPSPDISSTLSFKSSYRPIPLQSLSVTTFFPEVLKIFFFPIRHDQKRKKKVVLVFSIEKKKGYFRNFFFILYNGE